MKAKKSPAWSEHPELAAVYPGGINSALKVSDLLHLKQDDAYDDRGRVLDAVRTWEIKIITTLFPILIDITSAGKIK
jgi:hypothetical protein